MNIASVVVAKVAERYVLTGIEIWRMPLVFVVGNTQVVHTLKR